MATHTILTCSGQLWHKVCWKRTCWPSHQYNGTTLRILQRLGRKTILWHNHQMGLHQTDGGSLDARLNRRGTLQVSASNTQTSTTCTTSMEQTKLWRQTTMDGPWQSISTNIGDKHQSTTKNNCHPTQVRLMPPCLSHLAPLLPNNPKEQKQLPVR